MLQDLELNQITEIDFLNGQVVKIAKQNNFKPPLVSLNLIRLIRQAEERKLNSPMLTGEALLKEIQVKVGYDS